MQAPRCCSGSRWSRPGPTSDTARHAMLGRYSELRPRESTVMTLAGRWGDPDWPRQSPSKKGRTLDERQLAGDVETLGLGQRGYELLIADTKHLVATREFKSLVGMIEPLLTHGCVLSKHRLEQIHKVCGKTELEHKTIKTAARPRTELGEFSASAAAYSIDRDREQIVRGAFGRTIARWQASDKRIPLHWNHSAAPKGILGLVDPGSMRELPEGLFVRGKVDLDGSTVARDAWRLMKDHAVSLAFGYLTVDSFRRPDGVKELRELAFPR
jgi:HK97 family phage prohead protease